MSEAVLIDNSAWSRLQSGSVPDSRANEIANRLDAGEIAVCLPFILEAGVWVRGLADHDALFDGLVSFTHLQIDRGTEWRALDAQAQLAAAGHHKVPPIDLIIAGLADRHEAGVLHYDKDFDAILDYTDLEYGSEWLMPRGSLG